jgi:hypothetical protein
MDHLISKYRSWIWSIPDTTGDLIACGGYITWCGSLAGALLAFEAGALIPMIICLGIAGLITLTTYIN